MSIMTVGAKVYTASQFTLDDIKAYPGWFDPTERWGSFACPVFTAETTLEILADLGSEGLVVITIEDIADMISDPISVWDMGRDDEENSINFNVYPLGAYSWVWTESFK